MVTREELLERARGLVPSLKERASHTEELRHIPSRHHRRFHRHRPSSRPPARQVWRPCPRLPRDAGNRV